MVAKLTGKIGLITGGTDGIGFVAAKRFIEEGAQVVVTGRRDEQLKTAVAELGPSATGVQCDSTRTGDLDRLYKLINAKFGRLDILLVNAGSGAFAPLGTITEEFVDRTFNLNVKSVIFTVQKALPIFSDGGSVILMGSVVGSSGKPAFSIYSASKAAVRALARNWILDLKERKIRVNVISPGPTDTPGLTRLASNEEQAKQLKSKLAATVPLGRLGRPEEIASAALFLASDDSSFVTGIELFVDGGVGQI